MRKPASRRRKRQRSKKSFPWKWAITVVLVLFLAGATYHYREGLAYYFSFKTDKKISTKERRLAVLRNHKVLENHRHFVAGIDVSQYQGLIDWPNIGLVEEAFPVHFVFIRASAGKDKRDVYFNRNWEGAKARELMRGAYHYYRPDENSLDQAALFISQVRLQKGDLPPVLDIEQMPKNQSMDSLKVGLSRWLSAVEKHYGVQPILYSGSRFYEDFLKDEFPSYRIWIANYNFFVESPQTEWTFWQFSENGSASGIHGPVDLNLYTGNLQGLLQLKKP